MKRIAFLMLATMLALSAQPRRSSKFRPSASPRPKSALVDPNDRVFPDILAGGGYETIITFINMTGAPAQFTLTFYDDNGNPLNMPVVNSDGSVGRNASTDFSLDVNTSVELVVPNVDGSTLSAWTYLSGSGGTTGIAGMAVVRSKDSQGNVVSESVESLSNTNDYDFYAAFDNIGGVTTGLLLINPANSTTLNIHLSAQDQTGSEIVGDRFQLQPGTRTLIMLPTAYPALAGTSGKLRVTGDITTMSAICFRVSPAGNLSYSPIFNWSGMFN